MIAAARAAYAAAIAATRNAPVADHLKRKRDEIERQRP